MIRNVMSRKIKVKNCVEKEKNVIKDFSSEYCSAQLCGPEKKMHHPYLMSNPLHGGEYPQNYVLPTSFSIFLEK